MVRPTVHPVEAPPLTDNVEMPRQTLKDVQGMPGTLGGFILRFFQFSFSFASLYFMSSTSDFPSVTAFRKPWRKHLELLPKVTLFESWNQPLANASYLVAAVSLQALWSLTLAIADIYANLVRRSYRNSKIVRLFSIGDGITSTLTFSSACASAGITVLIGNDLNDCEMNHCGRFETATAMAFMSWFAALPSFFLNFWTLASK